MNSKLNIGATIVAIITAVALVFVQAAGAPNKPKHPRPSPQPPPTQPASPPVVCAPGTVPAGKDGQEGNNDSLCVSVTPPASPPAAPPLELRCDLGMTEIGRSATQVKCAVTTVVIKTRTKTRVKVVKVKQRPKILIRRYCPRKKVYPLGG